MQPCILHNDYRRTISLWTAYDLFMPAQRDHRYVALRREPRPRVIKMIALSIVVALMVASVAFMLVVLVNLFRDANKKRSARAGFRF